jgi:hypothetical protein
MFFFSSLFLFYFIFVCDEIHSLSAAPRLEDSFSLMISLWSSHYRFEVLSFIHSAAMMMPLLQLW